MLSTSDARALLYARSSMREEGDQMYVYVYQLYEHAIHYYNFIARISSNVIS